MLPMMKLHLDRYAFDTIISNVSRRSKVRRDILEKDYYVNLVQQLLLHQMIIKQLRKMKLQI